MGKFYVVTRHAGRFLWALAAPVVIVVTSPIWVPVFVVVLICVKFAELWKETA